MPSLARLLLLLLLLFISIIRIISRIQLSWTCVQFHSIYAATCKVCQLHSIATICNGCPSVIAASFAESSAVILNTASDMIDRLCVHEPRSACSQLFGATPTAHTNRNGPSTDRHFVGEPTSPLSFFWYFPFSIPVPVGPRKHRELQTTIQTEWRTPLQWRFIIHSYSTM